MARQVFGYSYDRKEFDAYIEYDGSTSTTKTTISDIMLKIKDEIKVVATSSPRSAILLHKFDVNSDEICDLILHLLNAYQRCVVVVITVDKSSCAKFPKVWTATLNIKCVCVCVLFFYPQLSILLLICCGHRKSMMSFFLFLPPLSNTLYIEPLYINNKR
jgi:hypothetical protein